MRWGLDHAHYEFVELYGGPLVGGWNLSLKAILAWINSNAVLLAMLAMLAYLVLDSYFGMELPSESLVRGRVSGVSLANDKLMCDVLQNAVVPQSTENSISEAVLEPGMDPSGLSYVGDIFGCVGFLDFTFSFVDLFDILRLDLWNDVPTILTFVQYRWGDIFEFN
eukprot:s9_g65.t1